MLGPTRLKRTTLASLETMSASALHAAAFYREVASTLRVWTVRDDEGYPAPPNASGVRAQPFWSSRARAERIISTLPAYKDFHPVEIAWHDFCESWVPELEKDGVNVGVNWSGDRAVGFDIEPRSVVANVEYYLQPPPGQLLH